MFTDNDFEDATRFDMKDWAAVVLGPVIVIGALPWLVVLIGLASGGLR